MPIATLGRSLGNELYITAFPLYRVLYGLFKSYTDRVERRLLRRHIAPGAVVIDAGANIGIYSRFLSKCVGPPGTVHSFEPSPDNYKRLRQGVRGCPNVVLNQLALSDQTGDSILYLSDELNVDHRAYPTDEEARETIAIRTTTLDDYFRPGQRVDLIKMDIQGYELHALRGAERVLADNPRLKILLEFWPYGLQQAGASAAELLHFLCDHQLTVFRLCGNDLVQYKPEPGNPTDSDHYLNLFIERNASDG